MVLLGISALSWFLVQSALSHSSSQITVCKCAERQTSNFAKVECSSVGKLNIEKAPHFPLSLTIPLFPTQSCLLATIRRNFPIFAVFFRLGPFAFHYNIEIQVRIYAGLRSVRLT